MLQQILRDMWVDPEILAELDEGQKQTLFCKMRAEQVRRWRQWDEKMSTSNNTTAAAAAAAVAATMDVPSGGKRCVNFLLGEDGEPWVWVMGEHADDKSIEQILETEARATARQLVAENLVLGQDVVVLHMRNEKNLASRPPAAITVADSLDIYCSVEELRDSVKHISNYTLSPYQKTEKRYGEADRAVLHEIPLNTTTAAAPKVLVAQKVALWEQKMMEERIFKTIQRKQLQVAQQAEKDADNQEAVWREQERKAKQAEQQIREIARKAREEHRLACTRGQDPVKSEPTLPATRPPCREAVIEWYRSGEVCRRAGIDQHNNVEPWFHGLITRQEAESLLAQQDNGTFLVRLSERIWGYTITYRAQDKCKHYLVDASNGHYQFLGSNQVEHSTLGELVSYHRKQPLSGGECLVHSCPRPSESTAFQELLRVLDR